jgi:hypothetical protein
LNTNTSQRPRLHEILTKDYLIINVGEAAVMFFDDFNLAYGAFGVFGDYENGSTSNTNASFSDKFFGAVEGRFSAKPFVTSGHTEFRFIGVEAAYSHKFGSYANYRQMLQAKGGYYVDPRTELFSVGLTTEVIFHNRNDNGFQHGIRGFLGTTMGHNDLDGTYYKDETASEKMFRNLFPKASYFITFKNYFGTAEVGNNFFVRFGYKF